MNKQKQPQQNNQRSSDEHKPKYVNPPPNRFSSTKQRSSQFSQSQTNNEQFSRLLSDGLNSITDQDKNQAKYAGAQVESNKTVFLYMMNLICMILMCIFVMGILIIYLVVIIEGSMWINPIILVHLSIPTSVLVFNIYTIMLEDQEEVKFFKRGKGYFLLNVCFLGTLVILSLTLIYKILSMSSYQPKLISSNVQNDSQNGGGSYGDEFNESVLEVEEIYVYTLSFVQSLTLKEYVKSKLQDLMNKKRK
eukprot:403365381